MGGESLETQDAADCSDQQITQPSKPAISYQSTASPADLLADANYNNGEDASDKPENNSFAVSLLRGVKQRLRLFEDVYVRAFAQSAMTRQSPATVSNLTC